MSATWPARRSRDQRLAALERANQIRYRRAAMRADLKAGADPLPLLENPPDWLLSMKAEKFLLSLPRVGAVKAGAILRSCAISPAKTVGGLSDRQRPALAGVLRDLRPSQPPVAATDGSGRTGRAQTGKTALSASERGA